MKFETDEYDDYGSLYRCKVENSKGFRYVIDHNRKETEWSLHIECIKYFKSKEEAVNYANSINIGVPE